ncbi:MAG: glycosyltransferase [Bacteroidetes bacterium]|nr:glycosyltransferase [Bacteroidota bacterium]
MNTKVSIITVCKNSEKTIERTILSVLNQTYRDIEYIIIDGASTDATTAIIKKYEPQFGGRLKVISERDAGIYDAMNKGIKCSTGELIGIINSDDWYNNTIVEVMADVFQQYKDAVLYGYLNHWEDGKIKFIQNNTHETLPVQMIPHPSCFVPLKLYQKYGMYNTKYAICADYEFMLRLFTRDVPFQYVSSAEANFSHLGVSTQLNLKSSREYFIIRREYGYMNSFSYYLKNLSLLFRYLFLKFVK